MTYEKPEGKVININTANLPKGTIVVDSNDKAILNQAIKNVVEKNIPSQPIMTATVTKRAAMPILKWTKPITKGCRLEVCQFESLKGTKVYICQAEVMGGTAKAIIKRGSNLHNGILAYVLTHTHEQLEKSGIFEIRDATPEEIQEHGASKDKKA